MGRETQVRKSFLRRLLHDKAANTLAISAAAVVPIMAMIGSGLDLSRAYLVQTRMQQACDSAALAARKKLSASETTGGQIPTAVRAVADDFFDANFVDGSFGSRNTAFTLTAGTATRMDGTASVELPSSLMAVVGFEKFDISVNCSAELNLPNIDVMLVLDLSSSMNTNNRIGSLRQAVLAFYDEVHAVKPPNARIRIGVVPYSSTVNVGRVLIDTNPDWIADSWRYQTREAEFNRVSSEIEQEYFFGDELVPEKRASWGVSGADLRWPTDDDDADDACNDLGSSSGTSYNVGSERWVVTNDTYLKNQFTDGNSSRRGACRLRIRKFRRITTETLTFARYRHFEATLDTSQFKRFQAVSTNTGTQGAAVSSTWNGCIEERATVPQSDWTTIPAEALDLDINTVPDATDPNTQWKPQWARVTFPRPDRDNQAPAEFTTTTDIASHSANCPSAARKMIEYPLVGGARNTDFASYINSLTPNGGTMHDIGMIWGARFLTPNGLFGSENATAPNGDPIRRYIVFMTDGEMGADPRNYIGYGNPNMDGRFFGFKPGGQWSEQELANVHNRRLAALCERIKDQNVTIYTVTFDLPQNNFTSGCASGTDRALAANGTAQLVEAFRSIASSVAELRLVG